MANKFKTNTCSESRSNIFANGRSVFHLARVLPMDGSFEAETSYAVADDQTSNTVMLAAAIGRSYVITSSVGWIWWVLCHVIMLRRLTSSSCQPVHAFESSAAFTWNRHASTSILFQSNNKQQQLLLNRGWGRTSSFSHYQHHHHRWRSSLLKAEFRVGDVVLVQEDDTKVKTSKQGVIQEIRGRGWYTIRLQEDTLFGPVTLKCRGAQLQHLASQPQQPPKQQQQQKQQQKQTVSAEEEERIPLVTPPPPPPTIINLDQALLERQTLSDDAIMSARDQLYLDQVAHHATFSKWVIFTDLHCAPSSLTTCLQVLQHVHQLAVERNAGILFLGDWWHHRGTLRVDCVNAVLDELSTWHVPMILIPGNHDQVTLGGHSHGLTVLENAYRVVESSTNSKEPIRSFPGPLVFSYPTLFRQALFIPHIRDNANMESVLLSSEATKVATSIFCHVDTKGAMMNDMIRSEGGIPPYLFPTHIPIYTGHFHKPHVLTRRQNETSIEYLGSPYQTTMAEAQQEKELVVVDANQNWTCIQRIPIKLGPRHWKVFSVHSLFNLKPGDPIQKNDRVVLTVSKENLELQQGAYVNGDRSPLHSHIKALRDCGASVEIRSTKASPVESISGADASKELEEMTPFNTWKAFLSAQVQREAISNKTSETLWTAGLQVLEKLDQRDEEEDSPVESTRQKFVDLQLHNVKIEGFGPFQKPASYPLHDRGLVLLRGTNKDGGSDSNGSGKSSLAMAALWALTGSIDPCPTQDSKNTDIVNDNSKVAKVSVSGSVNGVEFTITRMKASKKGQLSFILGGEDLTTQAAKETQLIIDEKLGAGPEILARTIFHGQHTMNGLLESSDTKLKEELSLVVPLSLWQEAATFCRAQAREASKNASGVEGMLKIRTEDLDKLQGRLEMAKIEVEKRQESLRSLEEQLQVEMQWLEEHFNASVTATNTSDLNAMRMQLSLETDEVTLAVQKQQQLLKDRDNEVQPFRLKVDELTKALKVASEAHLTTERDYDRAQLRADTSNEVLKVVEEKWNIKLEMDTKEVDLFIPTVCPTCLQSIQGDAEDHSHQNIKQAMEADVMKALKNAQTASVILAEASAATKATSAALQKAEAELRMAQDMLTEATAKWDFLINEINDEISTRRMAQEILSNEFTAAATSLQRSAIAKQLEVEVRGAREAVVSAIATYDSINEDYKDTEAKSQELSVTLEEDKKLSDVMSDLTDAFGGRGVQAFVLQTAVDALETSSQAYLNELSDGSIQLQLSIDAGDRISRTALVRNPSGDFVERPLASLSGGQWRRCSIALSLGFADLVATRGRMRPSLCVFDEPLTFLDTSGRAAVGKLLRSLLRRGEGGVDSTRLSLSTIVVILQDLAAEELEEVFDKTDEVVKEGGSTSVIVDEAM